MLNLSPPRHLRSACRLTSKVSPEPSAFCPSPASSGKHALLSHTMPARARAAALLLVAAAALVSNAAAAVAAAGPQLSLSINRVENAAAIAEKMDRQIESGASKDAEWNKDGEREDVEGGEEKEDSVGLKEGGNVEGVKEGKVKEISSVDNPFDGDRVHLWKQPDVAAAKGEVHEEDFPPKGAKSKPLPPHETVAMYRQIAKDLIGYDKENGKLVEKALRKQVSMLEVLVLKGAMPVAADFGSVDDYRKALSLCEQTKLDLREVTGTAVKLTNENNDYKALLIEERATLKALESRVDHPELTSWIVNRATRLSSLFNTDETEAAAKYAKRLIAPEVEFAKSKLSDLEHRVEQSVDAVVPSRYGHVVALTIAAIIIAFPTCVTLVAMSSIHKAISIRQHVLLCNVFLAALVAAVGFCGVILREDPLEALHVTSDSAFFAVHLFLFAFCSMVLAMLCRALYFRRDERDLIVFGSQIFFFMVICHNYNSRVLKPALLGYAIDVNPLMYIVYLLDFSVMTLLTVSTGMAVEDPAPSLPEFSGETVLRRRRDGSGSAFSALATGLSKGINDDSKDA